MSPLFKAALAHAAHGVPVFPLHGIRDGVCTCGTEGGCASPGKHPRTRNGLKNASRDPDQIAAWWRKWPDANIGGCTGADSGLGIAVDIDPRHGGDLAILENGRGPLPVSPLANTGGGGIHLFFAHPGYPVPNKSGLLQGVDIRGDGGYVVLPPSLHFSGQRYAFAEGRGLDVSLPPLPKQLAQLLQPPAPRKPRASVGANTSTAHGYGEMALRNEGAKVADAAKGSRNGTLNAAAFSLGQLVGGGVLDRDRVERELLAAALTCGLTEHEAERTLRSGFDAGILKPRGAPPRAIQGSGASRWHPELNDVGNAEWFARLNRDRLRYVAPWKKWIAWDGRRWSRDQDARALALGIEAVRALAREAATHQDDDMRAKRLLWAAKSHDASRIRAMVALAQPLLAIRPDELDDAEGTGLLLNCENGTLDLRTGELRDHRPGDFITKIAGASFDPNASHTTWDAFLSRMVPDDDVRSFLRRASGYTLSGDTTEEKLFFVHGPTQAGKSTFAGAIDGVLGEYSLTCEFESFLRKRGDGGIRNDIARLAGVRMALSLEMDEGRALAEALVKNLTGGDVVTARFLHQEFFEFKPAFKLWLVANDKPRATAADGALWRRILLVPFEQELLAEERNRAVKVTLTMDPGARAAILAWMVRGYREWREQGLAPPDAVQRATDAYRAEQDRFGDFVEDRCAIEPQAQVAGGVLAAAYGAWCQTSGERSLSAAEFGKRLRARGAIQNRTKAGRFWSGIRLRAPDEDSPAGCQVTGGDGHSGIFSSVDAGLRKDGETGVTARHPSPAGELNGGTESASADVDRALDDLLGSGW